LQRAVAARQRAAEVPSDGVIVLDLDCEPASEPDALPPEPGEEIIVLEEEADSDDVVLLLG
jgi:hypothetical protein